MTISWIPEIERTDQPLYLAIIEALAEDIVSERLQPDFRLPTHRELADALGVAVGTITKAYAEAEQRGLIRGEGRRGTFVGEKRRESVSLSSIVESKPDIIDLCKNHPTQSLDPDPSAALRTLARRADNRKFLQYSPGQGLSKHREAGASWLETLGVKTDPDLILPTAGAHNAILISLATVANRGDVVAAECYAYPGIKPIADLLGLQLVGLAMDNEGIIPDALDKLCRQRTVRALYCNPTLQNPTNTVLPVSRREAIAAIAGTHGVTIVEDDLLRALVDDPPPPISAMAPERSFLIISSSKVIAGGLRAGYVVAPPRSLQRLGDNLRSTILSMSLLPLELLTIWINDGTVARVIASRKEELTARQKIAREMFGKRAVCTDGAANSIWLHLPEQWTTTQFTMEAARRGVAVAPAELFVVDSNAQADAVRVSISSVSSREALREGLGILVDLLESKPCICTRTI